MPLSQRQKDWIRARPEKVKEYGRRYYLKHREFLRERNRLNSLARPEAMRYYGNKHNLKKYGLTPESKIAMLEGQGGLCKICGTSEPGKSGWHVDHCHKSGKVRGLLCMRCNTGIGYFKDDPELLTKATKYLLEYEYGDSP